MKKENANLLLHKRENRKMQRLIEACFVILFKIIFLGLSAQHVLPINISRYNSQLLLTLHKIGNPQRT